ncbi:MAG: hypothetical protein V5804_07065 [Mucilaginibacter sp.]
MIFEEIGGQYVILIENINKSKINELVEKGNCDQSLSAVTKVGKPK